MRSGTTLGRYQLLVHVASGGTSTVWAAHHAAQHVPSVRKIVAIKVARAELAKVVDSERMLLDEARIASQIQHPNVATVYELGEHEGQLFLAMEWVSGDSLATVLATLETRRLEPRIAARIVAHACAGLHAAHELVDDAGARLGVVHRNVCPQKILLSANGHVKVADFGIAKVRGQLQSTTVTGEIRGKVGYLSPEQMGSNFFDARADIFALGCVLYEATVGERAFKGEESLALIYEIMEGRIVPPRSVVPDYPSELEAIVLRALASEPGDRFQTAEEMRLALERWIAASGPLVTERQIAEVVQATVGGSLERRKTDMRRVIATLDAPSGPSRARGEAKGASRRRPLIGVGLALFALSLIAGSHVGARSRARRETSTAPSPRGNLQQAASTSAGDGGASPAASEHAGSP